MKQEPICCRADNALAARLACVLKRPIFYLAAYINNYDSYPGEFPSLKDANVGIMLIFLSSFDVLSALFSETN